MTHYPMLHQVETGERLDVIELTDFLRAIGLDPLSFTRSTMGM
jgi:hypothetical protein